MLERGKNDLCKGKLCGYKISLNSFDPVERCSIGIHRGSMTTVPSID
jgi:hypothetical protein